MTPNDFLNGRRCPKCYGKFKKTTEQFINELQIKNPNIIILGDYVGANINIKCKCVIDECIWYPTPAHLLSGEKCPKCSNVYKRSHEEFVKDIKNINPNINVLSKFVNTKKQVLFKCLLDGYTWSTIPDTILVNKSGCPRCAGNAKKTHEEFLEEINKINHNILVIGKYENSYTKIKCKCLIDSFIWSPIPNDLLSGKGCPKCSESHGEKRISTVLCNYNIKNIPQMKFEGLVGLGGGKLSYDFYLPDYNILIEYQGEFHDGSGREYTRKNLDKQKEHDKCKKEYAQKNNIKLLEIWYYDFDNINSILNKELKLCS